MRTNTSHKKSFPEFSKLLHDGVMGISNSVLADGVCCWALIKYSAAHAITPSSSAFSRKGKPSWKVHKNKEPCYPTNPFRMRRTRQIIRELQE